MIPQQLRRRHREELGGFVEAPGMHEVPGSSLQGRHVVGRGPGQRVGGSSVECLQLVRERRLQYGLSNERVPERDRAADGLEHARVDRRRHRVADLGERLRRHRGQQACVEFAEHRTGNARRRVDRRRVAPIGLRPCRARCAALRAFPRASARRLRPPRPSPIGGASPTPLPRAGERRRYARSRRPRVTAGASASRSAARSSPTSRRSSGPSSSISAVPACARERTTSSGRVASRERNAPTITTCSIAADARYRMASRLSGSAACRSSSRITAPPAVGGDRLHEPHDTLEREQSELRVREPGSQAPHPSIRG